MKRSIAAVAALSAICSLPVSAGEINLNERYSFKGIHTLVISQRDLNPIIIGINIVPISTTIATYPGSDMLLSIEGSSFLGTVDTPRIETGNGSGILTLDIGYRSPFKAGLRVGNIRIGILIPESCSAGMSNSRLTIREVNAQRIDLVSEGRAKTECNSVHAEQWRVQCGSGAFIAREISGEVELEGFDGNTDIAFSRFEGRPDIRSGGGNITVKLPDNTNLEMELISKTGTAQCDFDLSGENRRQTKGHKSGFVGAVSENYLSDRAEGLQVGGVVSISKRISATQLSAGFNIRRTGLLRWLNSVDHNGNIVTGLQSGGEGGELYGTRHYLCPSARHYQVRNTNTGLLIIKLIDKIRYYPCICTSWYKVRSTV